MNISILNPVYSAVAWVLMQIHAGLGHIFGPNSGWAWGLSIVLLTVCVRILIFPLFMKQIRMSRVMQELQPQMQDLRKRFKDDKQRLQQEMMKLYQEKGANPLGGCLPLVAQIPIFVSLYTVLKTISDGHAKYGLTQQLVNSARHAHIFGVTVASRFVSPARDLAQFGVDPTIAKIVIGIAVAISATTTFLTVRQSMGRSIAQMPDNPMAQQQKFLMFLSPLFALFGLTMYVGVLIYWVTTNSWTLAQQHWVYSRMPALEPAAGTAAGGGAGKAPAPSDGKPAGPSANGSGGLLRRLRKPEPVQPTVAPVTPKIVRQQPARQTRAKRTGKS